MRLVAGRFQHRPRKLAANGLPWSDRLRAEDRGHSTPCLIWTGAIGANGYGRVWVDGRRRDTHRVAYEREHGDVPAGCHVHHRCEVRECVNPAHLEALRPGAHRERHQARDGQMRLAIA